MKPKLIFSVSSNNNVPIQQFSENICPECRNSLLLYIDEILFKGNGFVGPDIDFYQKMMTAIKIRNGILSFPNEYSDPASQIFALIKNSKTDMVCDFLELIFRIEVFDHFSTNPQEIVNGINCILTSFNCNYHLTDIEIAENSITDRINRFRENDIPQSRWALHMHVVTYPVIVNSDKQMFRLVISPALDALRDDRFKSTDKIFFKALIHLRKGEYDDCFTKCCSALESALKIICKLHHWDYRVKTDILINTIIENFNLPSFYKQTFVVVANLRNNFGSAHANEGEDPNRLRAYAHYATHQTASAIILFINANNTFSVAK